MDIGAASVIVSFGAHAAPSGLRVVEREEDDTLTANPAELAAESEEVGRTVAEAIAENEEGDAPTTDRVVALQGLTQTKLSIRYDQDADVFVSASVDKGSGKIVQQYPFEVQVARIAYINAQIQQSLEARLDFSA
jgi:hypothetical protein